MVAHSLRCFCFRCDTVAASDVVQAEDEDKCRSDLPALYTPIPTFILTDSRNTNFERIMAPSIDTIECKYVLK